MKELSIEEKAKRYDKAIEKLHEIITMDNKPVNPKEIGEYLFTELKESEDERIRKALLRFHKSTIDIDGIKGEQIIAWLEKQGESKPIGKLQLSEELYEHIRNTCACIDDALSSETLADINDYLSMAKCSAQSAFDMIEKQGELERIPKHKIGDTVYYNSFGEVKSMIVANVVTDSTDNPMYEDENGNAVFEKDLIEQVEPMFHEGDWVVYCNKDIDIITNICDNGYEINKKGFIPFSCEDSMRLWTIRDAQAGDVLCDYHEAFIHPLIFILKKFERVNFGLVRPSDYSSYCFLTAGDKQEFKEGIYHHEHNIEPATKEQRDLLFQKMKEAGYEWDDKKLELKKVEQKPIVKTQMVYPKFRIGDVISPNVEDGKGDYTIVGFNEALADYLVDGGNIPSCSIGIEFIDANFHIKKQKQEWSEEDKMHLDAAIHLVSNTGHIETANWLKSLKERYAWKPSGEQITWLYRATDEAKKDSRMKQILNGLLSDLKKLKG